MVSEVEVEEMDAGDDVVEADDPKSSARPRGHVRDPRGLRSKDWSAKNNPKCHFFSPYSMQH